MNQNLQDVLDAARRLPPEERRRLAEKLLEDAAHTEGDQAAERAEALAVVDELYGAIKGLDRETLVWLAEDEELCGY
jgi:hypothetical protein